MRRGDGQRGRRNNVTCRSTRAQATKLEWAGANGGQITPGYLLTERVRVMGAVVLGQRDGGCGMDRWSDSFLVLKDLAATTKRLGFLGSDRHR
jgi:hypothetical protein